MNEPSHSSLKSTRTITSRPAVNLSLMSLLKPNADLTAANVRPLPLPILPAQDSLVQLRSHCKRKIENSPLDELRALVSAKRKRRQAMTHERYVRFQLEANQVYERDFTEEDLFAAWMSPVDQLLVKKGLYEVIFMFRNGVLNPDVDSLRGIEFRAYSGMSLQKQNQAKQYRQTVLSHQHQSYLAQLSESLSAYSAKEAIELALFDREEARAAFLG